MKSTKLKEAKQRFFIDVAIELFMDRSISEVTIKDIAAKAGVGEATIYRYFGKKESIVAASVMGLQEIVEKDYFHLDEGKTGYEKLKCFYLSFLDLFIHRPLFYKFLKEFDAFMANQDPSALDQYGSALDKYHSAFVEAYEIGLKDGTIEAQKDIETFYFASTHAVIELCKKLSSGQIVVSQDLNSNHVNEVRCLIDVILKSLKTPQSKAGK